MNLKKTALVQSFKNLDSTYFFTVVLDFIYYILFVLVGSFFFFRVLPKLQQLEEAKNQIANLEALSSLSDVVMEFKAYTLLTILLLLLNYHIIKWLIWKLLFNETILAKKQGLLNKLKPALKELSRFFIINMILLVIIVALTLISHIAMEPKAFSYLFMIIYLPLFCYLVLFTHPIAVKEKGLKKTLKQCWDLMITKFYKFIGPYLLMFIVFFLWLWIIQLFLALPAQVYVVVYLIWLSLFFNWCKVYAKLLLEKTK